MNVTSSCSLAVSLVKTKGIKVGSEPSFVNDLPVCDQLVEIVKQFPYLGIVLYISRNGKIDNNVKIKVANVFCLSEEVHLYVTNHHDAKHAIYKTVVLATLLYMF